MSIKLLPSLLIDKIAAGEVVERPASVVKELVENALDAKASQIEVLVQQGGKKSIQVVDNGSGMSAEDMHLSVERHATSKIKSEDDLFAINSLGFRGEALPSIASVSKLRIETKVESDAVGSFLSIEGGCVQKSGEAGLPQGSSICVEDLFYNTPARQKFMRSDAVELGHLEDVLLRLALGAPRTRFVFKSNGKLKWVAGGKDPFHSLCNLLPKGWSEDWLEVFEENPQIQMRGWIAHPRINQSNGKRIYFYLNGRNLKDRLLQSAIQTGFNDYLMRGRYPVAVLYLKIKPTEVDVNVHPMKREVRFHSPNAVFDFVCRSVRKALEKELRGEESSMISASQRVIPAEAGIQSFSSLDPCLRRDYKESGDDKLKEGAAASLPTQGIERDARVQNAISRFYENKDREVLPQKTFQQSISPVAKSGQFGSLKVLGQLNLTYILCQSQQGELVVIDQHAAHERIGYDQLKQSESEKSASSQRLLIPLTWEVSAKVEGLVLENLPLLKESGFDLDSFGNKSFVVKSIPSWLKEKEVIPLLEKSVSEFELNKMNSLEGRRDLFLKTAACHKQIRAKDFLSHPEMEYLLREMDKYGVTHCPHGRPVAVHINAESIEKWFKRT